jgi:hypothetical protein
VRCRSGGRIVSNAVIIAVAVNRDGRREVLGIDIAPRKPRLLSLSKGRTEFLRKLARRGLRDVKPPSPAGEAIPSPLSHHLPGHDLAEKAGCDGRAGAPAAQVPAQRSRRVR